MSNDSTGYAVLSVGPLSPHACVSFERPARYTVSVKGSPEVSLLLVVLRGRDRVEDISWRVYLNEVKVSREFKPQHILPLRGTLHYVYVADVTPVARGAETVELAIRCHAGDTFVEAAGLVSLLPGERPARARVYAGVSRIEGDRDLRVADTGFSVLSLVGRSDGGAISAGGVLRKISGLFEFSELLTDNAVDLRGPLSVYAAVSNTFEGRPPEVTVSVAPAEPKRLKLVLANPGDYPAEGVDLRLLRGAQTVGRLDLRRLKPRESIDVVLDDPASEATAVKVSYEFSGQQFMRMLRLVPY